MRQALSLHFRGAPKLLQTAVPHGPFILHFGGRHSSFSFCSSCLPLHCSLCSLLLTFTSLAWLSSQSFQSDTHSPFCVPDDRLFWSHMVGPASCVFERLFQWWCSFLSLLQVTPFLSTVKETRGKGRKMTRALPFWDLTTFSAGGFCFLDSLTCKALGAGAPRHA